MFSPDDGACGFGRLDPAAWPFGRFVSLGANNSLTQQIGSNDRACGQCIQARCVGQVDLTVPNSIPSHAYHAGLYTGGQLHEQVLAHAYSWFGATASVEQADLTVSLSVTYLAGLQSKSCLQQNEQRETPAFF